jgi:hypothetical protein
MLSLPAQSDGLPRKLKLAEDSHTLDSWLYLLTELEFAPNERFVHEHGGSGPFSKRDST